MLTWVSGNLVANLVEVGRVAGGDSVRGGKVRRGWWCSPYEIFSTFRLKRGRAICLLLNESNPRARESCCRGMRQASLERRAVPSQGLRSGKCDVPPGKLGASVPRDGPQLATSLLADLGKGPVPDGESPKIPGNRTMLVRNHLPLALAVCTPRAEHRWAIRQDNDKVHNLVRDEVHDNGACGPGM